MTNPFRTMSSLIVTLLTASAVNASAVVEFRSFSNPAPTYVTVATAPAGLSQTIVVPDQGPGIYRARTTSPATEDLGRIILTTNALNTITFFVAGATTHVVDPSNAGTVGARSWRGFESNSTQVNFQATVTGDLTGSITGVPSGSTTGAIGIARLETDGDILANVTSCKTVWDLAVFRARSLGAGFSLQQMDGEIGLVTFSGSLRGSIFATASNGEIGSISVTEDIDSGTSPVGRILATRGIGAITARSIRADIAADAGNFSSTTIGPIGPVTTTGPNGHFQGCIEGTHLVGNIDIDGDCRGLIRLGNQIGQGATLQTNQTIRIGGTFGGATLTTGNRIRLPLIAGQIRVNDGNMGGTWITTGPTVGRGIVVIGDPGAPTATLTSPTYATLATNIGGGAAGLAPYNLHKSSCVPVADAIEPIVEPVGCGAVPSCNINAPNSAGARTWATMRMYGAVVFNVQPGEAPVTVMRRTYPFAGSWVDVTSDFRFDIFTTNDGGGGTPDPGERVIRIRRVGTACADKWFPVGYEYKIEPVAGKLKCKGVAGGNTVDVFPFAYHFTLPVHCEPCSAPECDITADGLVSGGDLAAWFAAPMDMNGDGAVNAADAIRIIEGMPQ